MSFVNSSIQRSASPVVGSVPSGGVAGNFMLAECYHDLGDGTPWTRPDGWNLIWSGRDTNGQDRTVALYWRIWDSEPVSYEFHHGSTTGKSTVVIRIYSGQYDNAPFDVAFDELLHKSIATNNNNPTLPNITTNTNGAIVIASTFLSHDDITEAGAPADFNLREYGIGGAYDDSQVLTADRVIATAGEVIPGAWTNSDNGNAYADGTTFILALKPPGGIYSVDDVDGDEVVDDGQQDVPVTTSNFPAPVTEFKLSYGGFESVPLAFSGSPGAWFVDFMDTTQLTEDVSYPPPGVPVQLIGTNGSDSDDIEITIIPKAGWSVLTALNAVQGMGTLSDREFSDGSIVCFNTQGGNVVVQQNLVYDAAPGVNTVEATIWDIDTGALIPVRIGLTETTATHEYISHLELVGGSSADSEKFKLNRKLNRWENRDQTTVIPLQ